MTQTRVCCFIHSPAVEAYHYPPESPFKTERAARTKELLRSIGSYEAEFAQEVAPVPASKELLSLIHTEEYLDALQRVSAGEIRPEFISMGLGVGDCPVFPTLYGHASLAAGATVTGARLILDRKAQIAFNPSGGFHHAKAGEAGGFCYINDVALGCKVLMQSGKRVLCLDLDAHHGNGTQELFYDSSAVFTVSLHESGKTIYPWGGFEDEIGAGQGLGFNVNLPLPAGTDDELYVHAFNEIVPPLIYAFSPDVIVLELGMDVLSVDPLVHMKMTNNAFAEILPRLLQFDTPMLVTGGGGYDFESSARGWALMWTILTGMDNGMDDLAIGMGGVFLGSAEWGAGLRDPRIYSSGEQRKANLRDVGQSVDYIKRNVFPMHGIE